MTYQQACDCQIYSTDRSAHALYWKVGGPSALDQAATWRRRSVRCRLPPTWRAGQPGSRVNLLLATLAFRCARPMWAHQQVVFLAYDGACLLHPLTAGWACHLANGHKARCSASSEGGQKAYLPRAHKVTGAGRLYRWLHDAYAPADCVQVRASCVRRARGGRPHPA